MLTQVMPKTFPFTSIGAFKTVSGFPARPIADGRTGIFAGSVSGSPMSTVTLVTRPSFIFSFRFRTPDPVSSVISVFSVNPRS